MVYNNIANSYDFLTTYTSYTSVVGTFVQEFSAAINYWTDIQSCDVVSSLSSFYIDLNNNKFTNFNNDFIYFWVKKYNSSVIDVVNSVSAQLGTNSYFQDISDSIGLLVNTKYLLDLSVIPIFDVTCSTYGVPITYPPALNNKLSSITQQVNNDLSIKTTSVYRSNILNIQLVNENTNNLTDSTQPHGLNLVTDISYYTRYVNILPTILTTITNNFNSIFNYIQYFSNINNLSAYNPRDNNINQQLITNFTFNENVEGVMQKLDILQKKVYDSMSSLTIGDRLAITPQTTTSTYSTSSIDSKFLNSTSSSSNSITPATPSPISTSTQAVSSSNTSNSSLQQPNNNIQKLPVNTTSVNQLKVPIALPSANQSTFTSNISSTSSGNSNNPVCNFNLPEIQPPDFSFLQNSNMPDISTKIKNLTAKVTKIFDVSSMMKKIKSMVPDFGAIFKSFYSKLFDCKNNKN